MRSRCAHTRGRTPSVFDRSAVMNEGGQGWPSQLARCLLRGATKELATEERSACKQRDGGERRDIGGAHAFLLKERKTICDSDRSDQSTSLLARQRCAIALQFRRRMRRRVHGLELRDRDMRVALRRVESACPSISARGARRRRCRASPWPSCAGTGDRPGLADAGLLCNHARASAARPSSEKP